jgi:hypothetical protein
MAGLLQVEHVGSAGKNDHIISGEFEGRLRPGRSCRTQDYGGKKDAANGISSGSFHQAFHGAVSVVHPERMILSTSGFSIMALSEKSSHFIPTKRPSGENAARHLAMNIRQPILAALVLVQKLPMIDSQQMKYRRVEVVNVDRILGNVVGEVVGASVDMPLLHTRPGKHRRETARVVVAAALLLGSLGVDRSPELSTPHDERVFEQPALLEVRDQPGGGVIGI